MKTTVADTSLLAYDRLREGPQLGAQQRRVLDYLREHAGRDYTRKELARALGLEPGTIAGRVNELIAVGLIVELPRRTCAVSGQSAHAVRASRNQPEQAELWEQRNERMKWKPLLNRK